MTKLVTGRGVQTVHPVDILWTTTDTDEHPTINHWLTYHRLILCCRVQIWKEWRVKPMTHTPETGTKNRRHKFHARFCSVCHTVWSASGVKFLPAPVSGVKWKLLYFCARNQQERPSLIGWQTKNGLQVSWLQCMHERIFVSAWHWTQKA